MGRLRPAPLRGLLENLGGDLRAGWRRLRAAPVTSLIAVLTLGLGIGANTALFSVVNAVLLRPLPYPEPAQLVAVYDVQPERGIDRQSPSPGFNPRSVGCSTRMNIPAHLSTKRASMSAATTVLPMSDVGIDFVRPYWRAEEGDPGGTAAKAGLRMVTTDYFATMRIPVREGRAFTSADHMQAPRIVMVNEEFARRVWAGKSAVGRQLVIDYRGGKYPYEVVGVAGNTKYYGLKSRPDPEIFIPHAQNPYLAMNVVARAKGDVQTLLRAAEREALAIDPTQPVHSLTTMDELMSRWTAPDRFALALFGAFAGLGLLLASVGIYGVVAQLVAARRREIGIRMALGAERRDVLQLVFGEALRFIAAGIGVGLLLAFALVRFISSLLYGVSAYDPVTFAAVVIALIAAAAAASAIPAGRAACLDPMTALREE